MVKRVKRRQKFVYVKRNGHKYRYKVKHGKHPVGIYAGRVY